jgi:flagellar basal-body rod modification protein FlgD
MSKDISAMKSQQDLVAANSYLGHHVTVDAGDGATISGDVSGVEITDGTPRLVIGDYTYPVSAVVLVEPAAVTSSSPAATPGQ